MARRRNIIFCGSICQVRVRIWFETLWMLTDVMQKIMHYYFKGTFSYIVIQVVLILCDTMKVKFK